MVFPKRSLNPLTARTKLWAIMDHMSSLDTDEERLDAMKKGCKGMSETSTAEYQHCKFEDKCADENDRMKLYVLSNATLQGDYLWKKEEKASHCYPFDGYNSENMVGPMMVAPKLCCDFFIDLIKSWGRTPTGEGQLQFGQSPDSCVKGGFDDVYAVVNTPVGETSKRDQSYVLFGAGKRQLPHLKRACPNLAALIAGVNDQLEKQGFTFQWDKGEYPSLEPIYVVEAHFLFGFSALTHFLWHKDKLYGKNNMSEYSYLSVIVNLTPCESSFKVAAAEEPFVFKEIGSAAAFPSRYWHRTMTSSYGTVKVALFYKKSKPQERPKPEETTPDSLKRKIDESSW